MKPRFAPVCSAKSIRTSPHLPLRFRLAPWSSVVWRMARPLLRKFLRARLALKPAWEPPTLVFFLTESLSSGWAFVLRFVDRSSGSRFWSAPSQGPSVCFRRCQSLCEPVDPWNGESSSRPMRMKLSQSSDACRCGVARVRQMAISSRSLGVTPCGRQWVTKTSVVGCSSHVRILLRNVPENAVSDLLRWLLCGHSEPDPGRTMVAHFVSGLFEEYAMPSEIPSGLPWGPFCVWCARRLAPLGHSGSGQLRDRHSEFELLPH